MTDHQLSYCSVCSKKHFDTRDGIVCSLTGRKPDFDGACPTFDPLPGADLSRVGKSKPFVPESVGLGKRILNLLIDTVVYYVLAFTAAFVLFSFLAVISPDVVDAMVSEDGSTPLWAYLFAVVIFVFYYTVMEAGLGRTVGKLATGTCVVDAGGRKPSLEMAFKRSISRLVPFEAFSFLGAEPRGWHDRWTETYVVNKKDTSEDAFLE
jgi:uncharacterized RDD family membrane protein YckC